MKLYLERTDFTEESTIGSLYEEITIHDCKEMKFLCYILEDKCRQEFGQPFTADMKVDGETAIPYGTYEITITYSPAFKRQLPLLNNVPLYSGIRIHAGNRSVNSRGCLLCGSTKDKDFVGNSKVTLNKLMGILEERLKTEKVFLEIGRNEK